MAGPDAKRVYAHISKFAKPTWFRAFFELLATYLVLAGCFWLNSWWVVILCGLALLRLFIQFHDLSHLNFFPSVKANSWAGVAIGGMVLTPFGYWKFHHDYHHKHSNDLDFQQTSQTCPLTLKQYNALPVRHQRLYSFFTSRPLMLTISPVLIWAFFISRYRRQDLVFFFIYALGTFFTGRLWMFALGSWMAAALGVYLFHMQHTFHPQKRQYGKDYFENGLYGSSLVQVPLWLKWFTFGIEYHHIHHLNAKVPGYYLKECHDSAPADLFKDVKRLDFLDGVHMLQYNVWDEDQQCFTRA